MEKRIGSALILVEKQDYVNNLNKILSNFSSIIIARQGIPLHDRKVSLISIVYEGTTDQIGALTGQIGRLKNIKIKSVMMKPL